MRKNDGYKKIKSLFYIVAIISMIIAIVGKVRADTIPDYVQDIYSTYVDECTNLSNELKQDVKDYINSYEYSFMAEFYNGSSVYERVIYLTNYNNMGFCSWYGWSGYGNTYFSGTRCSNSRWNDGGVTLPTNISNSSASFSAVVILYNSSSSISLYCNKFTPNENVQKSSYSVWLYFNHSYSRAINSVPYYSDYSTPYNYGSQNNSANVKCYLYNGADEFKYFYSSEYDRFSGITDMKNLSNVEYLEEPILYDDNFIIYKSYGVGGISDPLLNIQYADNIFSQGYTYTSSTTYNLTFDVDGTETTVAISSSVYPDDFFENGSFRTSFDLIYRMLSNKIVNFSSAYTVTLTSVSMSSTAYPTSNEQGTSETVTKSTLCNLVLKGSQGSTDIESEVIPDITDVTTVFSQVGNTQDFYNSSGFISNNDFEVPDWTGVYNLIIYDNDQMSLQDAIDAGYSADYLHPYSALNLYEYDSLEVKKTYAMDLLFINGIIQNVDIVRVRFLQVNQTGIYVHADFVFYTNNYWTKLSIKGIGNVQSAIESGTYYTKSLYWYLKQRLDNMSDNIAEYEEKALSNQVVGNGYLQSINTNIISIKDSIDTGVNSIVSAISGISSGGSSYSLPSLSTELQRLFIPSLTWESIDFDEYMDSLGVLKIPFEMTNDVLDVTKASYSPTLDLHINDFEIDVTGNNDKLTVFEDQDYSFNPRSIFNNQAWTMLTYLNAFAVILAEAWFTYCHIFRREKADDR